MNRRKSEKVVAILQTPDSMPYTGILKLLPQGLSQIPRLLPPGCALSLSIGARG